MNDEWDDLFGFQEAMKQARQDRLEIKAEFDRRANDLPDLPEVGDKVLMVAGLIGRGHIWERIEGECVEVATNSAKVKFQKSYDKEDQFVWVPAAAIADVIKGKVADDPA